MALFYNTNQGNPLLGFQGFEYRYEYSVRTRSGHSWRVAMSLVRAIKCRARVYHKNKDELPVKGEHNHTGDEVGVIISFVSPKGQIIEILEMSLSLSVSHELLFYRPRPSRTNRTRLMLRRDF